MKYNTKRLISSVRLFINYAREAGGFSPETSLRAKRCHANLCESSFPIANDTFYDILPTPDHSRMYKSTVIFFDN